MNSLPASKVTKTAARGPIPDLAAQDHSRDPSAAPLVTSAASLEHAFIQSEKSPASDASHPSSSPKASPKASSHHGDALAITTAPARPHHGSSSTSLRISTNFTAPLSTTPSIVHRDVRHDHNLSPSPIVTRRTSVSSLQPVSRTPSLKSTLATSIGSVGGMSSFIPSPVIAAMGDVTPLPSPLYADESADPWKRLSSDSASPPLHQSKLRSTLDLSVPSPASEHAADSVTATSAPKRKTYAALEETPSAGPARAPAAHDQPPKAAALDLRSTSEYLPDFSTTLSRPTAVSGSHAKPSLDKDELSNAQMRREPNLAQSRGLTPASTQPPTPPSSDSSKHSIDGTRPKSGELEYFEARTRQEGKMRRWRSLGYLGQGTFSRVILATSQPASSGENILDKSHSRSLVAVKVCEHGPRGGASEERVEISLKRELEIMRSIRHPSLVNLIAWNMEPTRSILVLGYCPGGDLFEVATAHRQVLTPPLLRRIFAELVGAVSYLHERMIVHRDIKLENVLVNYTPSELADPSVDWATAPHSVVTLSDLGLSRRIGEGEKLETRCGSDDYAAPEVILGQPYDGRATDAWSLGVLLYALLEARLPFDPHPAMSDAHRMRSRASHRIARVEWRWVGYAGADGDHEADRAKFDEEELVGAMEITEGLLRRARVRWSVARVADHPWVRNAIRLPTGLEFRTEDEGEEI